MPARIATSLVACLGAVMYRVRLDTSPDIPDGTIPSEKSDRYLASYHLGLPADVDDAEWVEVTAWDSNTSTFDSGRRAAG